MNGRLTTGKGIDTRERANGTTAYRARKRLPGGEVVTQTFDTLDEAERWLLDVHQAVRGGRYRPPSALTVAQCVERYIERSASRWRANTIGIHDRNLRRRIEGTSLGRTKVTELTADAVQRWIDQQEGKPATIRSAGQTLSGALSEAVKLGIIPANPCSNVTYPGRKAYVVHPWTRDEVRRVYEYVGSVPRMHAFYRLALGTGARSGELRALRWVDVSGNVVHIHRTVAGEGIREGTKTNPGRHVVVPPACVEALGVWRGEAGDDDLIFPAPRLGGILQPKTLLAWHWRVCAGAGVPVIRLHDLRHTAATLMLAAGVPVKIVSTRLGHDNTQITMDVYQHVDTHMQEDAVSQVERWLDATT